MARPDTWKIGGQKKERKKRLNTNTGIARPDTRKIRGPKKGVKTYKKGKKEKVEHKYRDGTASYTENWRTKKKEEKNAT